MIISFEGPSAVGKTTLAKSMIRDFTVIPEVNVLFERPSDNYKFWYYEKQVERYQMARNINGDSILDGDPFQPLWYNWTYGFPSAFPNLSETIHFYQRSIREGCICFPDLYVLFQIDRWELVRRKESDVTRERSNFDKHLALLETQLRYFNHLKWHISLPVVLINLIDLRQAGREVRQAISKVKIGRKVDDDLILQSIHDFLVQDQNEIG